ncbi:MAG: hypothetical protein G01um101416_143 [Microgenomates group bacterium Gr01-1014_16]|nr:MAG: hypothetical protein G01um101416_143 [Microgenomates group bacterium Gr01-1014_16]
MIPVFLLLALLSPARPEVIRARLGSEKIRDVVLKMKTAKPATREAEFRTKKILIREVNASVSAQLKRRAVIGVISALNDNTITLTHQIQKDRSYTIFFDSNTVIKSKSAATSSAALAVGQRIIAVGSLKDTGILAKLIHIIPIRITPTASPSVTPTPGV